MLTYAAEKAVRPRAADHKPADERGLRQRAPLLMIGEWPTVSLDQVRECAELARGEDLRGARRTGGGRFETTPGANGKQVIDIVSASEWEVDRRISDGCIGFSRR